MSENSNKPTNLRANTRPTDGYVLSVDGKLKQRYDVLKEAQTAAEKLKERFPVIQIAIYDAAAQTYSEIPSAS